MVSDSKERLLIADLEEAFDPNQKRDRAILQFLIGLDSFMAMAEAYLHADQQEDAAGTPTSVWTGRRTLYFVVSAGFLVEAFAAFVMLDTKGWFDTHLPEDAAEREPTIEALQRLRELSPPTAIPPRPCGCCGEVHGTERVTRLAPENLRRLRDKAAFHWDSSALRTAYGRIVEQGRTPPILRFTGTRWRDLYSPLAADIQLAVAAETEDGLGDIEQVIIVARLLQLVLHSCLASYLLTRGAKMVTLT